MADLTGSKRLLANFQLKFPIHWSMLLGIFKTNDSTNDIPASLEENQQLLTIFTANSGTLVTVLSVHHTFPHPKGLPPTLPDAPLNTQANTLPVNRTQHATGSPARYLKLA